MIARIVTVQRVHLLRGGMYSSKGHCTSLPNDLQIASQLPRLPSEVGIIILRRRHSSEKIRGYAVERAKVQAALEGLCYGFPKRGYASREEAVAGYWEKFESLPDSYKEQLVGVESSSSGARVEEG